MPKVLRIINRLNLGGPTFNAAYLTKFLEPEYETLLVAGMKDETEASSEFIVNELGIKPHYISSMRREINLREDRKAYKEICSLIDDFKPDIVHTHAAKSGALGRLAAHNMKVKAVVHTFHGHVFHSYFSPLKTKVFIKIEQFLAKRTNKIIAISELQKRELSKTFNIAPEEKFTVIPLGFNLDRFQTDMPSKRQDFRAKYNVAEDEIAVGIIGRLVPIKNHELFIDSIAEFTKGSSTKIKAFIIGDGELRQHLEDYVAAKGLNDTFIFTSWIKNIDWAVAGLDIIALSSFNEGTPVSIIEAMSAGKPVISTNVGGIADIISSGKDGILIDDFSVSSFEKELKRLIEDKEFRDDLARKAADAVLSTYTYKNLVRNMSSLYASLLRD